VKKDLNSVSNWLDANQKELRTVSNYLENSFTAARDHEEVPIYLTKTRLKTDKSAFLKLKRKTSYTSVEDLTDLVGCRVLCLFEQEVPLVLKHIFKLLLKGSTYAENTDLCFPLLKELTFFNWEAEQLTVDITNNLINWMQSDPGKHVTIETPSWGDELQAKGRSSAPTQSQNSDFEVSISYQPIFDYTGKKVKKNQEIKVSHVKKGSGYRSIHLVGQISVGIKEVKFEVQIRTLIQDVWGELEHKLNYKGVKLPQIEKAFSLLAKELQAKDQMIADLKDTLDGNLAGKRLNESVTAPSIWMGYSASDLALLEQSELELLQSYFDWMAGYKRTKLLSFGGSGTGWFSEALDLWQKAKTRLEHIVSISPKVNLQRNHIVQYVIEMEEAFFECADNKAEAALTRYLSAAKLDVYGNNVVLFFRIAELYVAAGRTEQALDMYDRCEQLLTNKEVPPKVHDSLEISGVMTRLAHAYWSLGVEYTHLALEKSKAAHDLFLKNEAAKKRADWHWKFVNSLNNRCFYMLESALASQESNKLLAMIPYTEELEETVTELITSDGSEKVPINVYDTLAWCNFKLALLYKRSTDQAKITAYRRYISKAHGYVKMMNQSTYDLSPRVMYAVDLRRRHIESIEVAPRN
jgi:ppGpp synthetase/RelA/SpoT-type nucleotidyltranferase